MVLHADQCTGGEHVAATLREGATVERTTGRRLSEDKDRRVRVQAQRAAAYAETRRRDDVPTLTADAVGGGNDEADDDCDDDDCDDDGSFDPPPLPPASIEEMLELVKKTLVEPRYTTAAAVDTSERWWHSAGVVEGRTESTLTRRAVANARGPTAHDRPHSRSGLGCRCRNSTTARAGWDHIQRRAVCHVMLSVLPPGHRRR